MASALSILGQSAPSAATLTTIYTCPTATQTVVSTITACNRSATPTSIRIALRLAGAAISNEMYIAYDLPIEGNETIPFTMGITMEATDLLSVYATLATVSFNAFGQENT